jgi:predicted TIM-barrel fold metal-dependent hydrolase
MSPAPLVAADCDPPSRDPVPATALLPPGACDTHVHVFGPHRRYPLDARRNYTPHECALDDYRKVMRALGIGRAVLVQPSVYGTDNSALLDALREGGPAFRGIVVPGADIDDGALREMHERGVRGVRLNLVNPQVVGLDQTLALFERVAAWGWHLQVLLDLTRHGSGMLQSLCDRVTVPVVVDHMGKLPPGTRRHALFDLVKAGRCWVKLSAPYRTSNEPPPHADIAGLARALADANPAQVLWGSDWPHTEQHGGMPEACSLTALFHDWFPDAACRTQICVANPARLYGYSQEFIA